MRRFPIFVCLTLIAGGLQAQRLDWKLADFAPLTSVPWEKPGATMEDILQTIFREPDPYIRYPVLAAYLEKIPVSAMGEAFETCVRFEGSQTPDRLVNFFMSIWGQRDPEAAWAKAKSLFDAMVLGSSGPLSLDSWDNPPVRVTEWAGFRASKIWLQDLIGIGSGLERCSLPAPQKARLMEEFTNLRSARLTPLPETIRDYWSDMRSSPGLIEALGYPVEKMQEFLKNAVASGYTRAAVAAGLARWLHQRPEEAPKILQVGRSIVFPAAENSAPVSFGEPTMGFLMLWSRLDLPAAIRWTEAQRRKDASSAVHSPMGMLLSLVDEKTRQRWLREAKMTGTKDEPDDNLICLWAEWDPAAALKTACDTRRAYVIISATGGVVSPLDNASHGLGVLRDFDFGAVFGSLPEKELEQIHRDWAYQCMELWVDVDVGEAARWGWKILADSRTGFMPREHLLKLLSGDDSFGSDGDMIDRAFCALRFWSVWKPEEMRQWIATLNDPEMQKALTWMVEHPTGPPKTGPPTAVTK